MPILQLTHPAVKERLKARVAIDGPTGSGKTRTALEWATILAQGAPIAVVDTENRSAAYFAAAPGAEIKRLHPWQEPFEFHHYPVTPPYSPRDLASFIEAADDLAPNGVLVVDSLSHYWEGEGGTLDIADEAGQRAKGNSFAGWKVGTPVQRKLTDALVHAPFHVIVTMRSKMEYAQETYTDQKGNQRTKITKLGLAPVQRSGVEYEFTVVADMDLEHRLMISKSRCSLLADFSAQAGRSHEPAIIFRDWLGTGVERVSDAQTQTLTAMFNAIEDRQARAAAKESFVAVYGKPGELLIDQLDEAEGWIVEAVKRAGGVPTQPMLDESSNGDTDDYGADREPPATRPTTAPMMAKDVLSGALADALAAEGDA